MKPKPFIIMTPYPTIEQTAKVLGVSIKKAREIARKAGMTVEERAKDTYLRRVYGITWQERQAILAFQGGKCAICKIDLTGMRIEVDHIHGHPELPRRETVRGLLCGGRYKGCNRKLGNRGEPEWFRNAAVFLEDPPAKHVLKYDPTAIPRKKEKRRRKRHKTCFQVPKGMR